MTPEQQEPNEGTPQETPSYAGRGFLALLLLAAGGAILAYRLYPTSHPLAKSPNFVDLIFANNLVIFASRLVLLSAAGVLAVAGVFIVISFWVRGKAGHWMARFGPFETQAVENLQGVVAQWQEWWQEEYQRRMELEERVEQSDQLLTELNERYEEAMIELGEIRGDVGGDAT